MKRVTLSFRWPLSVALMLCGVLLAVAPRTMAQGNQVDAQPLTIGAGKDATINVKAFCVEYGKPFARTFPTVSSNAVDPQVVQILRYAISKGYTESDPYQVQLAIWRQTTGEWKATDHARAEEIFNNRAQAPAAAAASGTSIVQAAAANNIQVTSVNWSPLPATPEREPWAANGQLRVTNRGTSDLTVNIPTGIYIDAAPNEQDMVMYVTSAQAQATSTPAATATQAATATPAATATVAATATTAATAAPTAAPTAASQTLPRTGGDNPGDGFQWLTLLGAVMVAAGLGLAFFRRAETRA